VVVTAGLFYFTKFEIAEMPTPKAHERKDMSIQPSVHSSTALTQSLRRMPTPSRDLRRLTKGNADRMKRFARQNYENAFDLTLSKSSGML